MSDNDKSKPKSGDTAGKPSDGSQGKKPTAIIDLKATEVRDSKGGAAGGSNLKGAPGYDPKGPDSSKTAGDKSATSGVKPLSGDDKSKAGDTKDAAKTAKDDTKSSASDKTGSTKPGSSVPPVTAKGSAATATMSAAKTASEGAGSGKPKDEPAAPPPPPSAPPARAAKSGGGGLLSTFTHLIAGVIGGGIALYGAAPLEEQFNLKLRPEAGVSAAVERRLAALEQGSGNESGEPASAEALAALASRVSTTQQRLTALEGLQEQVATLSKDVEAAKTAAPSTPAEPASPTTAETIDVDGLRQRLAKLESTLSTLSSATNSGGQPSGVAQLATLSGKLADVETALNSQMASLRESLLRDVETRLSGTAETSAAAAAGTKRLDRELADMKTDNARLAQRAETLNVASEKLAATVRVLQGEAADLKVALDSLKGDVTQQFTKVSRPADVAAAVEPVATKIAKIEENLNTVVASESARKANAERIVLSLQLANLKRVLDRGAPFATELADVKRVAGDKVELKALEPFQNKGVPSARDLAREFQPVAYAMINAERQPKSDSVVDRLLAGAQSIVQVRRTDLPADANTTEASVARIEKLLKSGDFSGALTVAEGLPEQVRAPAKAWLGKLAARADVDRAIAKVEGQLKASLGGG